MARMRARNATAMKGREGRLKSVPGEPVARGTLGGRDLGRRHVGGDLLTQLGGRLASAHGCEIEPLVRSHEVGRHRTAGRIHEAELEQTVASKVLARSCLLLI